MDLEKLLQEYGENQRQQQQAAKQIRHIARRQRRTLTGIACVLLVATATIWTVQRQRIEGSDASSLVARNEEKVAPREEYIAPNEEVLPVAVKRPHARKMEDALLVEAKGPLDTILSATQEMDETSPLVADAEPTLPEADTQPDILQDGPVDEQLVVEQDDVLLLDPIDQTAMVETEADSRFHFMASVGASTMSQFSTGTVQTNVIDGLLPMENNGMSYSTFTPLNTFSANAGLNYAVVQKDRMSTSVGVAVSGQVQQGNVTSYVMAGNNSTQSSDMWVEAPDGRQSCSIFSLYAGVPLIFNMQPLGANKLGWNLTLTPLHAIFSSRQLGINQANAVELNPWRMTLGVGVTLPSRFPRRVSLTANLLPLYTSHSIHEVGIEIGF